MYFGHYAVAAAVKAKEPDVPAAPLFFGTGFLDIMDGAFILMGLDKVTPNLKASPYLFFNLSFIDWDHSLVAALFWSWIWGLLCYYWYHKNSKVGLLSGLVAFSHFLCDVLMHNNDLAMFPFAKQHWGMGMWGQWKTWAWVFEVAFTAILLIYAYKASKDHGERIGWQILIIAFLAMNLSPWLSPMKIIATWGEPAATIGHGLLILAGFVLPAWLISWLYNKSDKKAGIELIQR